MLKRLIEVALPLKEISEQSAKEKRQLSALHIWWARRPPAACRAVVFASLIPDPDDPACPDQFRSLVNDLLKENEYNPKNSDGSPAQDTPRNRCLEFLKHLAKWENSNKPHFIEPARRLVAAAHPILNPTSKSDWPSTLDPFAGGGTLPLEALRLGCVSHAVELNPVAHIIELCTLVFPQKFGQPNSLPIPDYISRLANERHKHPKHAGQGSLFGNNELVSPIVTDDFVPDSDITENEYLKNPLATDVKYWAQWVLQQTEKKVSPFFPRITKGTWPLAYFWARTIKCPNPQCNASIPLIRHLWLSKKAKRKVALRIQLHKGERRCTFQIAEGKEIDFDPKKGTMKQGTAECPFCSTPVDGKMLRDESKAKRIGNQLLAVAEIASNRGGKLYRTVNSQDEKAFCDATTAFEAASAEWGKGAIPNEHIPTDRPSPNSRGLSAVVRYGITTFGDLFNARQKLVLMTLLHYIHQAVETLQRRLPEEYAKAVATYVAFLVDKHADHNSTLQWWSCDNEQIAHTFGRQALAMVWGYCEPNPFSGGTCSLNGSFDDILRFPLLRHPISQGRTPTVSQGSATRLGIGGGEMDVIITDPPYYDSVPYSDLSDFFYVWLKRAIANLYPECFRTPLTPKAQEIIAYFGAGKRSIQKTPDWYEEQMKQAFQESSRVLSADGLCCVMFAHRTTSAWEALIAAVVKSGLIVTASWPLHTERMARMVARNAAALASSITLVCRKRGRESSDGFWDDVRKELKPVAKERLDFFWSQGIRGADFFISAIGPALSVFGKYERVTKLSGDEISVGQFLDEVRSIVTAYALSKVMKTTHTATIDADSQFYVIWKWSYGEAKVPADEGFKLAQALGMDTETMWDRTGILEKAGENLLAVPVAKRMKIKDLGEPNADTTPASLIDVLHRLCVFRDKNDPEGMAEFLGRSGQGRNPSLWLVAQAISEILPDGDKEKQLMQGLLNQRDQLEEAGREMKLF